MAMEKHRIKAEQWMKDNPLVYCMFDSFAMQMALNYKKFGAKLVAERVRWECRLAKGNKFKVNNNYVKYMAERWAKENPRYAHLITFRGKEK